MRSPWDLVHPKHKLFSISPLLAREKPVELSHPKLSLFSISPLLALEKPVELSHPKLRLFSIFPVGFCVEEAAFLRKWKAFHWLMGDSGYLHILRPPFIPVFPAMLLYNDPFCDLWASSRTSEAAERAVELGQVGRPHALSTLTTDLSPGVPRHQLRTQNEGAE